MILRTLTLVGGLCVGATSAQLPEFSQQYVQRLGGAVDALEQVVADFDTSAAAEGLSREAALTQMTGSAFVERRRADMERSFARYDDLRVGLREMQVAGPFMRAYHMAEFDTDIARAAWADFRPALPLTFAGVVFAAAGFVLGSLVLGTVLSVCRRTTRRALGGALR